jgi:hypothetical protein
MGGNEILYNLENADLFRPSELVSSLIELAKRPHQQGIYSYFLHIFKNLIGKIIHGRKTLLVSSKGNLD